MRVEFLGQPFHAAAQIGAVVKTALRVPGRTNALIITAWAKRSGLGRLVSSLREFRERGGVSELIVGLDEGGATPEGLAAAIELFSSVHVFHDPGRTFHPKIYLVEGPANATAVVGSSNATRGGLFTNYEASVGAELTLTLDEDKQYLEAIHDYRDKLLGLEGNCLRLDADVLLRLASDGRIRLGRESGRRSGASSSGGERAASMFSGSVAGLAGSPPSEIEASEVPDTDSTALDAEPVADESIEEVERDTAQREPERSVRTPESLGSSDDGTLGFWKKLSSFDVSAGSAPGQIIIPIRFRDFFGPLTLEFDRTAEGGSRQYNRHFPVTFMDGSFRKEATDARVILYEPASTHARPNIELRFTFRDKEIFNRLSKDDVLVFRHVDGHIVVERRDAGSMGGGRFALLTDLPT